jgi:flavin-dependent dehydrogenase
MARVVVVGAGLGGLASALFTSRRGHDVVVVERDPASPPGAPEDDFSDWRRPGVPQARQPHRFLGLAYRLLVEEAPDVIDGLLARGVLRADLAIQGHGARADDAEYSMCARRLVYEAAFREVVEREAGVEVRAGSAAEGLVVAGDASVPTVVGVATDDGETLDADVVVDATGRRSPVGRWLRAIDVAPPPTTTQECGFHYFSRFYRLRPDAEFPTTESPIQSRLDYVTALAFPGDNRTFSLALAVSADDPCRRGLRDASAFDRVLSAFDVTAPWIAAGEAITDVHTMARIENRWQRLVDDSGCALVGGLLLVGDSSLHTNPTFGRGVSLAFAQAQQLARTIDECAPDPIRYVADFESWTRKHLGVWFDLQVAADAARLRQLATSLHGDVPISPGVAPNPNMALLAGLFAFASRDDLAARALAQLMNLLVTPDELTRDEELMTRLSTFLDTKPTLGMQSQGPSRTEFAELAS